MLLRQRLFPGAFFAADFMRRQYRLNGVRYRELTSVAGISITRATSAYYTDAQGNLSLFPAGAARIGNRGLLAEGSAVNLILQSQTFDNASWSKARVQPFGSGSVANAIAAPDGTTTADKLVEDTTAAATHNVGQSVSGLSDSTTYCFTFFAKAGERTWAYLQVTDKAGTARFSYINLSTGAMGTTDAGLTALTPQALANGWYRWGVTFSTSTGATTPAFFIGPASGDGGRAYNGDGSSGLYLWGAQLETGSAATSYIPTMTGSATRNADVISIGSVTGLSYPVTLFAEFERAADTGASVTIFQCDDGDATDCSIIYLSAADAVRGRIVTASADQMDNAVAGSVAVGAVSRAALRVATNDGRACFAGALSAQDTSVTLPATPTTIRIGCDAASGAQAFAYLRRLAILPTGEADALLQARTS